MQTFLEERLSEADCPPKTRNQIALVAEEVFVNIASYAYPSGTGTACVRVNTDAEPGAVSFTFIDRGVPFDPLRRSDPDLTLPAEEREIGGLGIFLTKEIMDDVRYAYRDGQNMLTLIKRF